MTDDIQALLKAREATHGDFYDTARVIQELKRIIHQELPWGWLPNIHRESIHMVLHKIGRILAGGWQHEDHWADISGYAALVAQRIDEFTPSTYMQRADLRGVVMEKWFVYLTGEPRWICQPFEVKTSVEELLKRTADVLYGPVNGKVLWEALAKAATGRYEYLVKELGK